MEKPSERFEINKTDTKNWFHNLKLFTAPIIAIYLVSVLAVVTTDSNILGVEDFKPNQFTQNAMVVYVLNGILDAIRKFIGGK